MTPRIRRNVAVINTNAGDMLWRRAVEADGRGLSTIAADSYLAAARCAIEAALFTQGDDARAQAERAVECIDRAKKLIEERWAPRDSALQDDD